MENLFSEHYQSRSFLETSVPNITPRRDVTWLVFLSLSTSACLCYYNKMPKTFISNKVFFSQFWRLGSSETSCQWVWYLVRDFLFVPNGTPWLLPDSSSHENGCSAPLPHGHQKNFAPVNLIKLLLWFGCELYYVGLYIWTLGPTRGSWVGAW